MTVPSELAYAKRVLTYYVRSAWEAGGLKWNFENTAEIEEVVEAIYDAARKGDTVIPDADPDRELDEGDDGEDAVHTFIERMAEARQQAIDARAELEAAFAAEESES